MTDAEIIRELTASLRAVRSDYVVLFGRVSEAERFDTNAGDSAVSCVLADAQETCTRHANALVWDGVVA